jgi:hypothetical protein
LILALGKVDFIIIIIIIIIILGISFMQGIYTYIPETNHVPRKHCVIIIIVVIIISIACLLACRLNSKKCHLHSQYTLLLLLLLLLLLIPVSLYILG